MWHSQNFVLKKFGSQEPFGLNLKIKCSAPKDPFWAQIEGNLLIQEWHRQNVGKNFFIDPDSCLFTLFSRLDHQILLILSKRVRRFYKRKSVTGQTSEKKCFSALKSQNWPKNEPLTIIISASKKNFGGVKSLLKSFFGFQGLIFGPVCPIIFFYELFSMLLGSLAFFDLLLKGGFSCDLIEKIRIRKKLIYIVLYQSY